MKKIKNNTIYILSILFLFSCVDDLENEGVILNPVFEGVLTDSRNNDVLEAVEIEITNGQTTKYSSVTDGNGSYSIEVLLKELDDTYFIRVSESPNFLEKRIDFPSFGQEVVNLGVENLIYRFVDYEGNFKDLSTNEVVSDIEILLSSNNEVVRKWSSDEQGAFEFQIDLKELNDSYSLSVSGGDRYSDKQIDLPNLENISYNNVLEDFILERKTITYTGTLVSEQGANVLSGYELAVVDENNTIIQTALSDEQGAFTLEFNPSITGPGKIFIEGNGEFLDYSYNFDTSKLGIMDLGQIELSDRFLTLRSKVVSEQNQTAIDNAKIEIINSSTQNILGYSDENGEFEISLDLEGVTSESKFKFSKGVTFFEKEIDYSSSIIADGLAALIIMDIRLVALSGMVNSEYFPDGIEDVDVELIGDFSLPSSTQTDSDGSFSIEILKDEIKDDTSLRFGGLDLFEEKTINVRNSTEDSYDIGAVSLDQKYVLISGKIVDGASGSNVVNKSVSLISSSTDEMIVSTNEVGIFEFYASPDILSSSEFRLQTQLDNTYLAGELNAAIEPTGIIELDDFGLQKRYVELKGRLTRKRDGANLSNFEVELVDLSGTRVTTSDDLGRYSFELDMVNFDAETSLKVNSNGTQPLGYEDSKLVTRPEGFFNSIESNFDMASLYVRYYISSENGVDEYTTTHYPRQVKIYNEENEEVGEINRNTNEPYATINREIARESNLSLKKTSKRRSWNVYEYDLSANVLINSDIELPKVDDMADDIVVNLKNKIFDLSVTDAHYGFDIENGLISKEEYFEIYPSLYPNNFEVDASYMRLVLSDKYLEVNGSYSLLYSEYDEGDWYRSMITQFTRFLDDSVYIKYISEPGQSISESFFMGNLEVNYLSDTGVSTEYQFLANGMKYKMPESALWNGSNAFIQIIPEFEPYVAENINVYLFILAFGSWNSTLSPYPEEVTYTLNGEEYTAQLRHLGGGNGVFVIDNLDITLEFAKNPIITLDKNQFYDELEPEMRSYRIGYSNNIVIRSYE